MAERPRALSKATSMPVMKAQQPSHHAGSHNMDSTASSSSGPDHRGSSIFSSWRRRLSKRENSEQLASLEGKELRDALWRQQKQHEHHQQQQRTAQTTARPLRVIRYTPVASAAASTTSGAYLDHGDDDEEATADDDMSSNGSTRGAHIPHTYNYDAASPHDLYNRRASTAHASPVVGTNKPSRSMSRVGGHPSSRHQYRQDDSHSSTNTTASRLSITLSRLSLSSSAGSTIADYKAKKYDVEWKKDTEVADCQVCHLAFTKWSRRRHHCRVCGDIICDDCSPDQAHIVGRFTRPKRCCTACFSLLEAMMHIGDPQIKLFMEQEPGSKDWVNLTPPQKQRHEGSASGTATPVYHDRLAEIQRVTAAGMKARRAGGECGRFCVISARWLQSWLAFTRSHKDAHATIGDGVMADRTHTGSSDGLSPSEDEEGGVPGAIGNLSLLVMKKGLLVPRDRLVKCENQAFTDGDTQVRGDYQVIPVEVWDVLFRYYGGGPRIEVYATSTTTSSSDQWVIDVASVLCRGRAQKANPQAASAVSAPALTVDEKVIERALTERHDPYNILLDIGGNGNGSGTGTGTAGAAHRSNHQRSTPPHPHTHTQLHSSPQPYAQSGVATSSRPPAFGRSVSDSLTAGSPAVATPPPPLSRSMGVGKSSGGVVSRHAKPEPPVLSSQRHAATRSPSIASPAPPRPPQSQPRPPTQRREFEPDREPEPMANGRRGSRDAGYFPVDASHAPNGTESEPSAARATSAFALAMKQARLKQQRALAGPSRPHSHANGHTSKATQARGGDAVAYR